MKRLVGGGIGVEASSGGAIQTDVRGVLTERSLADEAPKAKLPQAESVDLPGCPAEGEDEPGPQQLPDKGKDKHPPR